MKPSYQYTDLDIPAKDIVAAVIYWVTKNLMATPTDLAVGAYRLEMHLNGRGHSIWASREQLVLALYKATDHDPVLSEWFKRSTPSVHSNVVNVSFNNGTCCHQVSRQVWDEASTKQFLKDRALYSPWWQRVLDKFRPTHRL